ncbi:MAG: hypothetical protein LBR16_01335 [Treponema sp.]|jgi:hypothetical protein|nr:hypothetical protein [Treponema sp.]
MRIAVVSVPARARGASPCAEALAKGMRAMGHFVDVIDAWTGDGYRLPGYEYLAVCAEQTALFGGKMPEALAKILAVANIEGKKGAAFLKKTSPFTGKALANLMRALEKEGVIVNWSEIILNPPHAEAIGKLIGA